MLTGVSIRTRIRIVALVSFILEPELDSWLKFDMEKVKHDEMKKIIAMNLLCMK